MWRCGMVLPHLSLRDPRRPARVCKSVARDTGEVGQHHPGAVTPTRRSDMLSPKRKLRIESGA